MKKKAILYCENNDKIEMLGEFLHKSGWGIFSGGKTGKILKANKIPYTEIECFGEDLPADTDYSFLVYRVGVTGRNVYASQDNEDQVQLVCVNVNAGYYKRSDFFEANGEHTGIDVKHTFLIQAAVKNYSSVLVLTDPDDYREAVIQIRTDSVSEDFRFYLAGKALNLISAYQAAIADSIILERKKVFYPNYFMIPYKKERTLHHGINRQQTACLYKIPDYESSLSGFKRIQGMEPSFNTLINIHTAWKQISYYLQLLKLPFSVESCNFEGYPYTTQFTPMAGFVFTVAVKNATVIGAALGNNLQESFHKTYVCDPETFENSVVGSSSVIDECAAIEIRKHNINCVIAPDFTKEAKQILSENKTIRLYSASVTNKNLYESISLDGGLLVQNCDSTLFNQWNVVTQVRPDQNQVDSMAFGMMVALSTKSYSAVVINDRAAIGISAGQTNMRKAVIYALNDAKEVLNSEGNGAEILVCDSVINFDDRLRCIADYGIKAIIQTGGASTDTEFIQYCNERGICMVFTGMKHLAY